MIVTVTVIAALILIVFFLFGNHLPGASASTDDADHPQWNGTTVDQFDESKIAGLNKYPGTYRFDIVGESHYQVTLGKLCGDKREDGHEFDTDALLVPYRNPHDPHAVGVLMGECDLVGHLNRTDARKLRIAMKRMKLGGCSLKVPGRIVGGWKRKTGDEGHYGVKLDLPV